MLFVNKINGKIYKLTNQADEQGICQVLDPETNQVMLMQFEELENARLTENERWKIARLIERHAELKEIYRVGTSLENRF